MAEKALAGLGEAARAAKLKSVRQSILHRLRFQEPPAGIGRPGRPAFVSEARGTELRGLASEVAQCQSVAAAWHLGTMFSCGCLIGLGSLPDSRCTLMQPEPGESKRYRGSLMPSGLVCITVCAWSEDGVELFGDERWYLDAGLLLAQRAQVAAAHAEQKILVGPPADEIRRICPGGGRVLGAGAVLRLGGSHHGGYGEADIAYTYRQLSRALHPDKNPTVPEAPDAFRRLREAAPGFVVCTGCRYRWNFRKNAKCWQCGIGLELAPSKPSPRGGVWADGGGGGSQLAHRGGGGGGPPKDGANGGKGGKGRGAASRGGGGGGAGDRGGGGFPKAPWSALPESELDTLLACGDPAIAARLQEAVRDARGYVAPAVAPAPKPLEQRLQSATAKRINLQRQLDEAADALVAAEDHLAECRGWRDEAAVNLTEAKEEENALLRQRAQAAGVVGAQPDGARQLTFNFDAESFDNSAELEEEAQATLRRLCDEGLQIMQGAQATFERNCQEHQQRIKRQIEEEAAKKRKRTEAAAAPSGGLHAYLAANEEADAWEGLPFRVPLLRQDRRLDDARHDTKFEAKPLQLAKLIRPAGAKRASFVTLNGSTWSETQVELERIQEFFEAAELHLIDQFGISEGERAAWPAPVTRRATPPESGMRDSWPISSLELVDLTPYMAAELDGEADFLHAAAAEPAPGTGGFSPPKSQSQGRGEFGKLHDAEVMGRYGVTFDQAQAERLLARRADVAALQAQADSQSSRQVCGARSPPWLVSPPVTRAYLVHVPRAACEGQATWVPLLLCLPGSGASAQGHCGPLLERGFAALALEGFAPPGEEGWPWPRAHQSLHGGACCGAARELNLDATGWLLAPLVVCGSGNGGIYASSLAGPLAAHRGAPAALPRNAGHAYEFASRPEPPPRPVMLCWDAADPSVRFGGCCAASAAAGQGCRCGIASPGCVGVAEIFVEWRRRNGRRGERAGHALDWGGLRRGLPQRRRVQLQRYAVRVPRRQPLHGKTADRPLQFSSSARPEAADAESRGDEKPSEGSDVEARSTARSCELRASSLESGSLGEPAMDFGIDRVQVHCTNIAVSKSSCNRVELVALELELPQTLLFVHQVTLSFSIAALLPHIEAIGVDAARPVGNVAEQAAVRGRSGSGEAAPQEQLRPLVLVPRAGGSSGTALAAGVYGVCRGPLRLTLRCTATADPGELVQAALAELPSPPGEPGPAPPALERANTSVFSFLLRHTLSVVRVDALSLVRASITAAHLIPLLNAAQHLRAGGAAHQAEASEADLLAGLALMRCRKFVQCRELWQRRAHFLLETAGIGLAEEPPAEGAPDGGSCFLGAAGGAASLGCGLSISPFAHRISASRDLGVQKAIFLQVLIADCMIEHSGGPLRDQNLSAVLTALHLATQLHLVDLQASPRPRMHALGAPHDAQTVLSSLQPHVVHVLCAVVSETLKTEMVTQWCQVAASALRCLDFVVHTSISCAFEPLVIDTIVQCFNSCDTRTTTPTVDLEGARGEPDLPLDASQAPAQAGFPGVAWREDGKEDLRAALHHLVETCHDVLPSVSIGVLLQAARRLIERILGSQSQRNWPSLHIHLLRLLMRIVVIASGDVAPSLISGLGAHIPFGTSEGTLPFLDYLLWLLSAAPAEERVGCVPYSPSGATMHEASGGLGMPYVGQRCWGILRTHLAPFMPRRDLQLFIRWLACSLSDSRSSYPAAQSLLLAIVADLARAGLRSKAQGAPECEASAPRWLGPDPFDDPPALRVHRAATTVCGADLQPL
ncbi:unnamed protein product, partial [Prorocentrum cordatum]